MQNPPKFGCVLLLLLLGLLAGNAAANIDAQKVSVNSVGPGQPFAIADLDGDVRPDLASIQAGSSTSGTTDYWIQLRLTTTSRQQSIRLVAPAGGLWIEARDVNGDHAIDLVFSTAWLRRPVAILLNDGHGSFSRVEPAAFPEAFSECNTNWSPTGSLGTDTVGVPPPSRAGACTEENNALHDRSPEGWIPPSSEGFSLSPFLNSQPGRAPPSENYYL